MQEITTFTTLKKIVIQLVIKIHSKYVQHIFTNITSKLSKDINVPGHVTIYDYLKHRTNHNLFLTPVCEVHVIGVVRLWESKTTTDCEV